MTVQKINQNPNFEPYIALLEPKENGCRNSLLLS